MTALNRSSDMVALAMIASSIAMAPACATSTNAAPTSLPPEAAIAPARPGASKARAYVDGVYRATGQYGNLPSSITVTVTLVDDLITEVAVETHATDPTSLDLQRRFAAAVPAVVVGKPIDEVKVGRLAGSSGTPKGFNAAIERIKEQARAATPPSQREE